MPEASEAIAVNTGPLIALDACGQLELLAKLHFPVLMPDAVLSELRYEHPGRSASMCASTS